MLKFTNHRLRILLLSRALVYVMCGKSFEGVDGNNSVDTVKNTIPREMLVTCSEWTITLCHVSYIKHIIRFHKSLLIMFNIFITVKVCWWSIAIQFLLYNSQFTIILAYTCIILYNCRNNSNLYADYNDHIECNPL